MTNTTTHRCMAIDNGERCGRVHGVTRPYTICSLHWHDIGAGVEVTLTTGWRMYRGQDGDLHLRKPREMAGTESIRDGDLPSESTLQHMLVQADEMDERAKALYGEASGIYERFEHGQPIIVRHHSTRQAQRDRNRADDRMRHASALVRKAADIRGHVQRVRAERKRRQMIASAPTITRDDVQPGDIVLHRPGRGTTPQPYRVVRVNAKSVSVETGFSWTDRIPYKEIVGVRKQVQP